MAEHEEQQPEFDRWSRPSALSRRGYVLAVVVPILIAAGAFGVVSLVASDDSGLSGTTVRLPVSAFGSAGGDAQIQGVLRLDENNCVYLEAGQDGADPGRTYAVWPTGYRATREGARLTIYDADRTEVAHDGDQVRMGGSYAPVGTFAGEPCLPDSGEIAVVESSVEVLAP